MESDDDFVQLGQFGRSQSVTRRSPNPTRPHPGRSQSLSVNRSSNHQGAAGSCSQQTSKTSQPQSQHFTTEERLTQLTNGATYLLEQLQEFSKERSSIKPPGSQVERKPNIRETCRICKKTYANKTTLFRHYRAIHEEMNPEQYHGISLNNNIVSLDTSVRDINCSPGHTQSLNNNKATHTVVLSNNDGNKHESVQDKMYKCEDCACYFVEKIKFDEHMKVQHGFEVVCKICCKNFLFKDIDAHVKESHPDVYSKKEEEEKKKENTIIKKVVKRQGKRVFAFVCAQCDKIMYDEFSAKRHCRSHKKGLKMKATPRVPRSEEKLSNFDFSNNSGKILFMCDHCNTCTGSYDAAVDHSQNHIMNTSHSFQCITQTCTICELKFEPLCYKKHMDLHYNNNELHKESFKYYKYKYQLLLTDNWFECYDMTEPYLKYMISNSVYSYTRSVKMRIIDEGVCSIYKCCQCDKFVEPAAVANHTLNYDTCLKVKSSYSCEICNRKYNNRLARDRHTKDHNSEVSFKVVIFNNERDKEFNRVLNDPNTRVNNCINMALNDDEPRRPSDAKNNMKVLYKCLCGLCFVHKQTADAHKRICPGKNPRKPCPKCNKMFVSDELVEHCFEHHLNEVNITIENVTPDVIVIDTDEEVEDTPINGAYEEIIEISSNNELDAENECFDSENVNSTEKTNSLALNGDANRMAATEVLWPEGIAPMPNIPSQRDTSDVEDAAVETPDILEYYDYVMTDHAFQDTNYTYQETPIDNPPSSNMETCNDIKCIPTNILLNPIRHDFDMITETLISEPGGPIKENNAWLFNPTDYSNVRRRPSLRRREITPTSSTIFRPVIVESLLTDDEDQIIPNQERDRHQGGFTANISNIFTDSPKVTKEMVKASDCAGLSEETSTEFQTTLFHLELNPIEQLSSQTDQIMDSFQSNRDTSNFNETLTKDSSTNNNYMHMNNSISPEPTNLIVDVTNIKQEFVDCMDIQRRDEFIAFTEQNITNCDKDNDVIKIEPKDTTNNEYKRNKENYSNFTCDNNVNYNDKNCIIC